jgi:hypothetical protein
MNKIHILWPTARPEVFKTTYQYWVSYADIPTRICVKVAVDNNVVRNKLDGYECLVVNNIHGGVGLPAHELTTGYSNSMPGDIIILASDDFFPPKGWDSYLFNNIGKGPCAYIILDGIQPYGAKVITLPIVNHEAFIMLNKILYHKDYHHLCSDVELYHNCNEMGIVKRDPPSAVLWEHRHYEKKMRDIDSVDRANLNRYNEDQATIRRRLSWPLSLRLK